MNYIQKKRKKILFDTNIVIDIITNRNCSYNPWTILEIVIKNKFKNYICSKQISDIYYILRKYNASKSKRKYFIKLIIDYFNVVTLTKRDIQNALTLNGVDFEDDLLISTALRNKITYILTNNKKDFIGNKNIKIISPIELIKLLN